MLLFSKKGIILFLLIILSLAIPFFVGCDSEGDMYTLVLEVDGKGSLSPNEGTHEYEKDTVITLKAYPEDGWKFIEWVGETSKPYEIETRVTMDSNKTIKAVFEEETIHVYEVYGDNGVIEVLFSEDLHQEPSLSHFSAKYRVDFSPDASKEYHYFFMENEEFEPLALKALEWDGSHRVSITFDPFEPKEEDKYYVLSLSYRGGEYIEGEPFLVKAKNPTIVSIDGVKAVEVAHGTSEEEALNVLPKTTMITDSNGDKHSVDLTWSIIDYNAFVANDYQAKGIFELPEGVDQGEPPLDLEVATTITVLPVMHTLTLEVEGLGSLSPSEGVHEYEEGTEVSLKAYPEDGWKFIEWVGEVLDPFELETRVIMDGDKTIMAVFDLEEDYPIDFVDSNLEYAIREGIEKMEGDLYLRHVIDLETLDARGRDIYSLEGIENLKSLQKLEVGYYHHGSNDEEDWTFNHIEDISPLSPLTQLEELYISHNCLTDITPLVYNEGLGSGSMIDIRYNYLDLESGSQNMNDINTLLGRGVHVEYEPQREVDEYSLTVFIEGVEEMEHSHAFVVENCEVLTFKDDDYDADLQRLQGEMTLEGEVTLWLSVANDMIDDGYYVFDDEGRYITSHEEEITFTVVYEKEEEPSVVTPEERYDVDKEVMEFIENLPNEDFMAETQEIVDFLQAHPAFESAGANETGETIWAIFNDGTLYFLVEMDTIFKEENGEEDSLIGADPVGSYVPSGSLQRTPDPPANIPPNQVSLLNGFGNFYHDSNPIPEIKAMLEGKGYEDSGRDASLDSLRQVNNDGVLYFRTHGGQAQVVGFSWEEPREALWTSTPVQRGELMGEATGVLADDLKKHRVGWRRMTNRYRRLIPWDDEGIKDLHYMITDLFIEEYWSFPNDSLVYLDACSVGSYENIIHALEESGASVIFGWTNAVTMSVIEHTSKFVFDRLLGANSFRPEDPPQRPFDYVSVFETHIGQGRGYGFCGENNAQLIFRAFPGNGHFGLLAPSIMNMSIHEGDEEMTIYGLFGEDLDMRPREVTIAGESLPVKSWDSHEIVVVGCTPDKEGEVIVEVDGIESNKIPITSWRNWEIVLTTDVSKLYGAPENTLIQEFLWQLDLRADIHSYREGPSEEPQKPYISLLQGTNDSTGQYQYYGSFVEENMLVEIEGEGSLLWDDAEDHVYVADGSFFVWGSLDMEAERIYFSPVFDSNATVGSITYTCLETGYSYSVPIQFGLANIPDEGYMMEVVLEEYVIVSGKNELISPDPLQAITSTYEWDGVSAQFTPDDSIER